MSARPLEYLLHWSDLNCCVIAFGQSKQNYCLDTYSSSFVFIDYRFCIAARLVKNDSFYKEHCVSFAVGATSTIQ